MEFKIAIEQDEDGWYIVTVPALPGSNLPGENRGGSKEEYRRSDKNFISVPLQ